MKRLFATALLSTVALLAAAAGSASAQCAPPYCPVPSAAVGAAANVTDTSATLSGAVNLNGASQGTWQIQVSTDGSFGSGVFLAGSGTVTASGSVSGTATGLQANTTYFFRVQIQTLGGTSWSTASSFTTAGTPSTNPPDGPGGGGGGNEPSGNAPVDPNRVSIDAEPRRDREKPFRYEISGGVEVDDGALCAAGGRVTITFRAGGDIIRERRADLEADCGYQREVGIPARLLPDDAGRIRVQAEFGGNRGLNARSSERISVRYG